MIEILLLLSISALNIEILKSCYLIYLRMNRQENETDRSESVIGLSFDPM